MIDFEPGKPWIVNTYTSLLTYSRWERFVFKVTGRWSKRVVERRLRAADADRALTARVANT